MARWRERRNTDHDEVCFLVQKNNELGENNQVFRLSANTISDKRKDTVSIRARSVRVIIWLWKLNWTRQIFSDPSFHH